MTSSSRGYPARVEIKDNTTTGWVVIEQVRTIDRIRFLKRFSELKPRDIKSARQVFQETLVDYWLTNR